jgi:hypothetical protein
MSLYYPMVLQFKRIYLWLKLILSSVISVYLVWLNKDASCMMANEVPPAPRREPNVTITMTPREEVKLRGEQLATSRKSRDAQLENITSVQSDVVNDTTTQTYNVDLNFNGRTARNFDPNGSLSTFLLRPNASYLTENKIKHVQTLINVGNTIIEAVDAKSLPFDGSSDQLFHISEKLKDYVPHIRFDNDPHGYKEKAYMEAIGKFYAYSDHYAKQAKTREITHLEYLEKVLPEVPTQVPQVEITNKKIMHIESGQSSGSKVKEEVKAFAKIRPQIPTIDVTKIDFPTEEKDSFDFNQHERAKARARLDAILTEKHQQQLNANSTVGDSGIPLFYKKNKMKLL